MITSTCMRFFIQYLSSNFYIFPLLWLRWYSKFQAHVMIQIMFIPNRIWYPLCVPRILLLSLHSQCYWCCWGLFLKTSFKINIRFFVVLSHFSNFISIYFLLWISIDSELKFSYLLFGYMHIITISHHDKEHSCALICTTLEK